MQVFLKYWHPDKLNVILERLEQQVMRVQRQVRMFIARRRMQFLYKHARQQQQVGQCHHKELKRPFVVIT